ncbi:unnamed protein product [Effrenium voratum]|uniref:Uncharacterized protein n=1 Tax=Effrenium voratum TaxID=2562239 RepID=A0AA36J1D0_9DINO|nr:unnamed protein product [Effrenium voratum]
MGVLPVLAVRIPAVVQQMTGPQVSNVLWATGRLVADPAIHCGVLPLYKALPILVTRAGTLLPSACDQVLCNSWGLALSECCDAFLEALARVATEAVGSQRWPSRTCRWCSVHLLGCRLPTKICCTSQYVTAKCISPMLDKMNHWGLCALTWAYQELDLCDEHLAFHQDLAIEVALRKFGQDVERSSLGPEAWKDARERGCD